MYIIIVILDFLILVIKNLIVIIRIRSIRMNWVFNNIIKHKIGWENIGSIINKICKKL